MLSNIPATLLVVLLNLVACCNALADAVAAPFTQSTYESEARDKALVLVSANWNRRWKCGAFENAQLQSLGFDRAGSEKSPTERPDILLEDTSLLPASPGFVNFVLVIEPGEYLFSSYKIKAAKSISQVGYFSGDRTTLIADGKSKAGSFVVAAGEVVYIGHFALDCAQAPMPWRFYPEDKNDFAKYLALISKENPELPAEKAQFRLFETTVMGNHFRLPE